MDVGPGTAVDTACMGPDAIVTRMETPGSPTGPLTTLVTAEFQE